MNERTSQDQSRPSGAMMRKMLPLAVIVGGLVAFFVFGGQEYLSFEALARHRGQLLQWYADNRIMAVAVFWAAYVLAVAFSLPGAAILTLIGGFVFGTWLATVYVVTAATVGAVGIFLAARYALRDYFRAKAGGWVSRFEAGFREDALSYLLVLRLVPIFPFWLVNLVPALMGVPLRTYVIGTLFGIIPGSWVYCSVGNGLGAVFDRGETPDLGIIFEPQILTPIVGLAALSMIPVVYKRYKKSRGEPVPEPLDEEPGQ
ncbi:MAG: TVP38/TMEM64 family protein [Rhodospirillales bacterium]